MSLSRRLMFPSLASAVLAPLVLLSGCGGGGSSSTGGTGTLSVSLADAPDPTISSLNITIDRVEAHVVNADDLNDNDANHWRVITTAPQTFDLLDLVKNETILGSGSIPAGHYTQVRLFPSNATVTDATGTHPVTIPSAANTGIKVNVDYTIGANQVTAILLDFNVSKSLIKTGAGTYKLQPVIPAVVKVLSGTVTGTVNSGTEALAGADVKAIYTAGSKYAIGTEVNTSFSLADGTFKVWALLPGTYSIVVTAPSGATQTKTGVIVSANQNTSVGTIALP